MPLCQATPDPSTLILGGFPFLHMTKEEVVKTCDPRSGSLDKGHPGDDARLGPASSGVRPHLCARTLSQCSSPVPRRRTAGQGRPARPLSPLHHQAPHLLRDQARCADAPHCDCKRSSSCPTSTCFRCEAVLTLTRWPGLCLHPDRTALRQLTSG